MFFQFVPILRVLNYFWKSRKQKIQIYQMRIIENEKRDYYYYYKHFKSYVTLRTENIYNSDK